MLVGGYIRKYSLAEPGISADFGNYEYEKGDGIIFRLNKGTIGLEADGNEPAKLFIDNFLTHEMAGDINASPISIYMIGMADAKLWASVLGDANHKRLCDLLLRGQEETHAFMTSRPGKKEPTILTFSRDAPAAGLYKRGKRIMVADEDF